MPSMIVCLQVQKRASSGRGLGVLGLVEAKEATIYKTVEAGEEIPLRSSHQHSDVEAVQLGGLPAQQKKAPLVRRGHVHAAIPQGQL